MFTNELNKENISGMILESVYPGFLEYFKAVFNPLHKEEFSPCLIGTENLIEEVKELIKESEEEIFSKEQIKKQNVKEIIVDINDLPKGNTLEERIREYMKLRGIELTPVTPVTPLQKWIDDGKTIVLDEIKAVEDNLEQMYETLAELNDSIDDEETRLSNLEVLLNTINS